MGSDRLKRLAGTMDFRNAGARINKLQPRAAFGRPPKYCGIYGGLRLAAIRWNNPIRRPLAARQTVAAAAICNVNRSAPAPRSPRDPRPQPCGSSSSASDTGASCGSSSGSDLGRYVVLTLDVSSARNAAVARSRRGSERYSLIKKH